MHEYSIAEHVIETVLDAARDKPLTVIRLRIGTLSGINQECLRFYLENILVEKKLQNVTMEIQTVQATCTCECGREYELEDITKDCPSCGGFNREITAGNDFIIDSIEVQDG